jgi:hypothetical protein
MSLTPQDAYTQFAAWVQAWHPNVFNALVSAAAKEVALGDLYRGPMFAERQSQRFGDYADYFSDLSDAVSYDAGDFADLDLTGSAGGSLLDTLDTSTDTGGGSLLDNLDEENNSIASGVEAETATTDIPIASSTVDAGTLDTSSIPTTTTDTPSAAASSVGSTLAANSSLITAALRAASTVLSTQAAAAVIQAQAQRAAAGLAPANVGYATVTDPTTGLVSTVPVLNTGTGQLPLTTAGINALAPATFLQNYGLYIMLGLAALVVAWE